MSSPDRTAPQPGRSHTSRTALWIVGLVGLLMFAGQTGAGHAKPPRVLIDLDAPDLQAQIVGAAPDITLAKGVKAGGQAKLRRVKPKRNLRSSRLRGNRTIAGRAAKPALKRASKRSSVVKPRRGAHFLKDVQNRVESLRVGKLNAPNFKPSKQHSVLVTAKQGLQSRSKGTFRNVAEGKYGDRNSRYLWTIDRRGVNILKEVSATGHVRKHSNLSSRASFGGEVWFRGKGAVVINAHSGRFGKGNKNVGRKHYKAAAAEWRRLGYKVEVR